MGAAHGNKNKAVLSPQKEHNSFGIVHPCCVQLMWAQVLFGTISSCEQVYKFCTHDKSPSDRLIRLPSSIGILLYTACLLQTRKAAPLSRSARGLRQIIGLQANPPVGGKNQQPSGGRIELLGLLSICNCWTRCPAVWLSVGFSAFPGNVSPLSFRVGRAHVFACLLTCYARCPHALPSLIKECIAMSSAHRGFSRAPTLLLLLLLGSFRVSKVVKLG